MKHFVPDRLARFCQFGPNKIWTAALIIMGVVYKPFDYAAGHVFGTTFAYLGFGALLILMVEQTWQGKYASELVRRIGIYSYSIYLWHEIVKQGVHAVWHGSLLIEVALYAPLAIGVGIAMAKLIECPMLRLREIVAK